MANGDSLLGHLSGRFTLQSENLATEALLYLLEHHDKAADAFQKMAARLQPGLGAITGFSSQDWSATDGAIPDLIGFGEGQQTPLVIEVKFWAPLTTNQPVTYLERLPEDSPGILLFLCPALRERSLVAELQQRCQVAGITATDPDGTGAMTIDDRRSDPVRPVGGNHRMAVVTWRRLLDDLEEALDDDEDEDGLSDLRQLRGLAGRQDGDAFLPLDPEEVSGRIGRRLGQYLPLIHDVLESLEDSGTGDVEGLGPSVRSGSFGHYVHVAGFQTLLMVHFDHWAKHRDTPLWLELNDERFRLPEVRDAIAPLLRGHPARAMEIDKVLVAPLELPIGETGDVVVKSITAQIGAIADALSGLAAPATAPTD